MGENHGQLVNVSEPGLVNLTTLANISIIYL
jgi:hypothetical protein